VRSPRKWLRRRVRVWQSQGLIQIAESMQEGLDHGRFKPAHAPGVAVSVALIRNAVEEVTK
jgi:hypothetical protein